MTKILLSLALSFCLFLSCKKIDHLPSTFQLDKDNFEKTQNKKNPSPCQKKSLKTYDLLSENEKVWEVIYLNDSTKQRIVFPGIFSDTKPCTLTFQNFRIQEYNYDGLLVDTGSYSIDQCGKVLTLNTNLSRGELPFQIEKLSPKDLEVTFYGPFGENGRIVKTRVKGTKQEH